MLQKAFYLHQRGKLAEAEILYKKVLAQDPKSADALHLLGTLEMQRKNPKRALELFDQAIKLNPAVTYFCNRGLALESLMRFDEALASFDRFLAVNPHEPRALNNRGNTLRSLKRFDEALGCFERALAIKPDFAEALNNRGNTLQDLKRFEEALASFDRALKIRPSAVGYFNRGNVLRALCRFDAALDSYDRALAMEPENAAVQNNRGNVLLTLGRVDEAVAALRQAMAIQPANPIFHSSLIFALNFDENATALEKQSERADWARRHAQVLPARPSCHDRNKERRLRIGYVSSHFRQKAASFAFAGVILNHDPGQFEVVCYSDTVKEDEVTARLRSRSDQWHETKSLADERLAALIRHERIDILVDLVGHMSGHRLGVFARKPAPIQVTGWGEPTGTGLKTMDYLLADSFLVPEAERNLLAERVLCLPNFLGYWTPEPLPEPSALPMLARGHVTFGCFNRIEKIASGTIASWASILRALPDARLLLKDRAFDDLGQQRRIAGAFAAQGIAAGRLEFRGEMSREAHLQSYGDIDIALDPFPHGGGMTTLDALSMGVPVLTWAGKTISSRLAAASLSALGLTQFIAADAKAYVALAAALVQDVESLSRLRKELPGRIALSEFGDGPRYAQAVERVYREIWRNWCAEPAP